jgi:N-methylhydantoinase A
MRYMLGIDVGGTFTDFVAYDSETKAIDVWKHLSVPRDPVAGILAGLQQFAHPEAIRNARLGTTIATNAVLERKGATVAYVTTRGFRDVIFIQRGNRKSHYDMSWVKPKPLVKRRHCFEVTERIDKYGNVITPLDEAGARAIAREIREVGEIEAVAISSKYANIKLQPGDRIQLTTPGGGGYGGPARARSLADRGRSARGLCLGRERPP